MFFNNTAMNYVAFKYAGVMAIQINEAMPGNGLGHSNLNILLHYSIGIVSGRISTCTN